MSRYQQYRLKDALDPRHQTSKALGFRRVLKKIEDGQHHLAVVKAILSGDLANHCVYASLNGSSLTIVVDSGVWATRLRFESLRLRNALRQVSDYARVEEIRIQIDRSIRKKLDA